MQLPELPWKINHEGYPGSPVITDAAGVIVCAVYQRSGHPMEAHPESVGVAKLIVNAPSLLATLRDVWRGLPDGDPRREAIWSALEPLGGVPPLEEGI